jgi:hypothetical protein
MKKKKLFIRIFGIFFLIFFIFAYFLFYFIPTVEKTNRHKRALKDMNLKIENFLDMETEISFSDERERAIFKEADEALRSKIPGIKSKEDFITLFSRVFNYLKKRGRADGVFKLGMTFNSRESGLNATTLLTDKRSLEQLLNSVFVRLAPSPSALLLKDLNHQTVFLRFSGNLRSVLNFINHIPWGGDYLRMDNITVYPGKVSPSYLVFLNVYFIDLRPKDAASSAQSPKREETDTKVPEKEDLSIDFNSPLLLRRVYENPMGKYPKRELLRIYKPKLNFVVDH